MEIMNKGVFLWIIPWPMRLWRSTAEGCRGLPESPEAFRRPASARRPSRGRRKVCQIQTFSSPSRARRSSGPLVGTRRCCSGAPLWLATWAPVGNRRDPSVLVAPLQIQLKADRIRVAKSCDFAVSDCDRQLQIAPLEVAPALRGS